MYCTLKLLTNLLKIFIIITNFYYMITYFIIIFSAVKPQYNGIVWMRECLYKRKSVVSKFPMQWTLLVLLIDKISVQWSQIVVGGTGYTLPLTDDKNLNATDFFLCIEHLSNPVFCPLYQKSIVSRFYCLLGMSSSSSSHPV